MPNIKIRMDPYSANVYHLMGNDENALSYALGHLMSVDAKFMLDFLKMIGILERIPGKSYKEYTKRYAVCLQEQAAIGPSGRRDIVLEAGTSGGLRVVFECKIGKGSPDACQLLRYSVGCDCGKHKKENPEKIEQMWGERRSKYIVSITRDVLSSDVRSYVSSRLSGSGIELRAIQWSDVLEVALRRLKQRNTIAYERIFLQQFVDFFKECYEMKSYQVEVMVKKDNLLNAEKIYLDGYMYVGGSKDIQLPLYFAPDFTNECVGKLAGVRQRGIHYISKVIKVLSSNVGRFKENPYAVASSEIKTHELWPHWQRGLQAIAERANSERWANKDTIQLYFLSKPVKLPRPVKGPMQIPPGYGVTILDLLTTDDLTKRQSQS